MYYNLWLKTKIPHFYFKKHLVKSWLEKKQDIYFTGISCFSLSQLKLLSVAVELMLNLIYLISRSQINFLLATFKCILMYSTKGYAENFLNLKKWQTNSTHLKQSMQLPLRCTLRYLNSDKANARWHPGFPVQLIYVSDWH